MKKILALAFALVFVAAPALAFHDDGVADCQGCHTMHNSQDGALVDPDSPNGNAYLLVDESPSDVCLGCHATRSGAVFSVDPLNPATERGGGNFIFLLEDNLNDGHGGATNPINGDAAGHNLVAPGHGLAADGTLNTAPGGSFPASVLGCTSCHDPHGTADFRLLYGAGRVVQGGIATFANAAPVATGIGINGAGESAANHTAYESGMSAWCGNCHGNFHDNNTQLVHPAGQTIGGTIATFYGLYNGTANLDPVSGIGSGDPATSYLPQVAFEEVGMTTAFTGAPTAAAQVSCITCHRAHATSAMDSGRWDFQIPLLAEDGQESGSYAIPDPYADDDQRSLCNKCHGKDAFDHIATP